MSDTRPSDVIASEKLQHACVREVEQIGLASAAATAYLQANFAQACAQALLTLVKQKNLVSPAELETALANAYNDIAATKRQAGIVLPPAPSVRR